MGGLSALILLAGAYQGLLGTPDMMVAGNGSSAARLTWCLDKAPQEGQTSSNLAAGALLAPLWLWRALMLSWALSIVTAIAKRLPSMWRVLGAGGLG